ncbi:MAG: protein translocase subunit SecD, partial [Chloroflexi bacterium]|nr:protein translocase subunit SecD [Chloroflexota bacterium]
MRIGLGLSLAIILVITGLALLIALPDEMALLPGLTGVREATRLRQGLDLQGGIQVLLEARPAPGATLDSDVMRGVAGRIETRVNSLGVSEPIVQLQGDRQIIVELPGLANPDEAIKVFQETGLLEFIDAGTTQLQEGAIVTTSLGGIETVRGQAAGATPVAAAGPVYQTILQGKDLENAAVGFDPQTNRPVLQFTWNDSAAATFQEYTGRNIGKILAITLDKRVINAATIQAQIGKSGVITGLTLADVQRLVIQLKSGALQVPLEVIQSRTVGASLGQDSLQKSLIAGGIGLGIVALFMTLYYRLPGLMSVLALLVYTIVTLALFKSLQVVLTLAGVAGFILSIGMAVDANVLIFSRLKEELRLGRPISTAIEAGFDHAWPSIWASNSTTLITCAILYWFGGVVGASIIRGFAVTLLIG